MPLPAFATLESSLAAVTLGAFENIRLTDGVNVFGAVLDRAVETVGEYGLSGERRDRISVLNEDCATFKPENVIAVDPATYTTDQILAMPRAEWKLDRKDSDDGQVSTWWLK